MHSTITLCFFLLVLLFTPNQLLAQATRATLPQASLDTTLPSGWDGPADATPANVSALKTALANARQDGGIYIIELTAGNTYVGNFVLPNNVGTDWIIIRTSNWASLPAAGSRATASDASNMAKLSSDPGAINIPTIDAKFGAHHYRFVGIEITTSVDTSRIVRLGTELQNFVKVRVQSFAEYPHHIIFDRVYVHGDAQLAVKQCMELDSAYTAIIDSTISEIHHHGQDSQTINAINGAGPFVIRNNYLEAAGENIMLGGGDSTLRVAPADLNSLTSWERSVIVCDDVNSPTLCGVVPSDIEIRGNHIFKPLSWRNTIPSGPHAGGKWVVKNLFELKNAQRVLLDGNILEHSWAAGQDGTAFNIKSTNQSGGAPFSISRDVTIRNNIVKHVSGAFKINAKAPLPSNRRTTRILIENNLIYDVDKATYGGNGQVFDLNNDLTDVIIRHNTFDADPNGRGLIYFSGSPGARYEFIDNIGHRGLYSAIDGDNTSAKEAAVFALFSSGQYVLSTNVIARLGANSSYPPDHFFPVTMNDVGFVDRANADYRIANGSPHKNAATDGTDIGANISALLQATACTISGVCVVSDSTAPAAPARLRSN